MCPQYSDKNLVYLCPATKSHDTTMAELLLSRTTLWESTVVSWKTYVGVGMIEASITSEGSAVQEVKLPAGCRERDHN